LTVPESTGQRLDTYLAERLEQFSRSHIDRMIKEGRVRVNSALCKSSYTVRTADEIRVHIARKTEYQLQPEKLPVDVLYEDEYLFVVNKPPGMVVHPGAGNREGTLVSALMNYADRLSTVGGTDRPGLVHRLDKDTSGVIIIAKNDETHWKLSRLFADRRVYKEYRALVWGVPDPPQGEIEAALGRSPRQRQKYVVREDGRPARSRYFVERDFGIIGLVGVILETGRTHQARIHLQSIGHPVLGDSLYGSDRGRIQGFAKRKMDFARGLLESVKRQMLHAYRIRLQHPFLGRELEITAPLPDDFKKVVESLEKWTRA